jgi:replicative DNA helicase Mcm
VTEDLHDGDKTGQWRDFLKAKYKKQISEISREYPYQRSLAIDYRDVEKFGVDGIHLADELLENPGKVLEDIFDAVIANELIRPQDGKPPKALRFRFSHLPRKTRIRDIRADDVNSLVAIEGRIMSASKVEPRLVKAVFRCGAGHFTVKKQKFGKYSEPGSCGTDGCRFKKLYLMPKQSAFVDSQTGRIQENLEGQRAGEQPQSLAIDLEDDLCGMLVPGERVILNGIIRSYQRTIKGEKSSTFEVFMEVNSIEHDEKNHSDLPTTEEEEEEIMRLTKSPDILTTIAQSILPAISGWNEEKKGLALSIFSGREKIVEGNKKLRGDIHVFLAGDPGISKTTLLLMLHDLIPGSVYISGKSTSAAGLTFSMRQDEYDKRWIADAGAAAMADLSMLFIDELALMEKNDITALIEFMESQRISIAKAGISATLMARCACNIAVNPAHGRFDMYGGPPLADQIDPKIPSQVISRCDLIYMIPDVPVESQDREEGRDILNLWRGVSIAKFGQIPIPLLQKYIIKAKNRKNPVLNEAAARALIDQYALVRGKSGGGTVSVTKRTLETLARLATAHAKMRFADEVTVRDAEIAVKVLDYSLKQVAYDVKTGRLDADKPSGKTREKRAIAEDIKHAILAQGGITTTAVIIREVKAGNPTLEDNRIMNTIEQMHREGILMEATLGKWRVA